MIRQRIVKNEKGLWDWEIFNTENSKRISNDGSFNTRHHAREHLNSILAMMAKDDYLFFT